VIEYHLTTVDNPFDPFEEFQEWRVFDTSHGYNTLELLDRVIVTSDDLSEADQIDAYNLAIDEIVDVNASGVHRKVSREIE
jgi:hypothetical protein